MSEVSAAGKPRTDTPPRIYVASLADYNAGRLHGRWIDADQPIGVIQDQIAAMLAKSREPIAEEWAIHDYENFEGLQLSEFEDLEYVAQVARLMVEHGPLFAGLVSHFGGASGVDEAARYMEEGYRGAFDSLADYARELVEECYGDVLKGLPDFIAYHIDYDGIGQDMELGGDIFTVECEHKLHVFDSCI
jgi:antirestriction protein